MGLLMINQTFHLSNVRFWKAFKAYSYGYFGKASIYLFIGYNPDQEIMADSLPWKKFVTFIFVRIILLTYASQRQSAVQTFVVKW